MTVVEMTDRDDDALTVTTTTEGVWITCTTMESEVTVGPLPLASLSRALTELSFYEEFNSESLPTE